MRKLDFNAVRFILGYGFFAFISTALLVYALSETIGFYSSISNAIVVAWVVAITALAAITPRLSKRMKGGSS